jgi:AcrR family transcriptional regulator
MISNMFKTKRIKHQATQRGDATRERLLDTALRLFRKRGFDGTTMRDIAGAARVAVGAAYYYFPSKEALVHAFYDRVQDEHAELVRATCGVTRDPAERVRAALLSKLDVLREDRALLGALFRYAGEQDHPLSVFSPATRAQRESAVATFALALEGARMPSSLRGLAARALWLGHLGLLLFFIHDRSAGQSRTRRLAERGAELFLVVLRLASLPGAGRILSPVLAVLEEAGLTPTSPKTREVNP